MDATELAFAGLVRQAELVRSGEVSPRELVELHLERIERYDPQLNALRVVFAERALAEAEQAAARRAAARNSSANAAAERPLLGVPVLIKDDVDVAGERTAKGSGADGATPASRDAEVVRRLRSAGAIVLGKTHTPELMQWPFTESATWGVTRNPWDLARTPGGSSGGSAAAVAAGLAAAALATDGAGSIRIPPPAAASSGSSPSAAASRRRPSSSRGRTSRRPASSPARSPTPRSGSTSPPTATPARAPTSRRRAPRRAGCGSPSRPATRCWCRSTRSRARHSRRPSRC